MQPTYGCVRLHHLTLNFCLQLFAYGRRIPLAELFARIDAVDADTIKRVANRFIFDRVRINILF